MYPIMVRVRPPASSLDQSSGVAVSAALICPLQSFCSFLLNLQAFSDLTADEKRPRLVFMTAVSFFSRCKHLL